MTPIRDEAEAREHFAERYGRDPSGAVDEVERAVIGAVWGANGYTTLAQADRLAERLQLRPGQRLLDLGAGRGWPGLYLARGSGAHVASSDLTFEGLRAGRARARREGVSAAAVVASGRRLPFAEGSFDAVVHTDVLC